MTYRALPVLVALLSGCAGHRGWFTVADAHAHGAGAPLTLEPEGGCPALGGAGPVLVMVHGIGGETRNAAEVRGVLAGLEPSALLSFHWSAVEETQSLVARFARGLSHLAECAGSERPLVVLAHSAGGVLSSLAVGELTTADGAHDIVLVTVASPLGGAGYQSWRLDLLPVKPFVVTVGGKLERYPPPAAGVRVVHVRTHPAGDHVMRQARSGHFPDDPRAAVPGAKEHALPVQVGHDEALLVAARALVRSPESFGLSRGVSD